MSKSIFKIILAIAVIVVPYIGLPLLAVAAIAVGIALTNTFLLGPSLPRGLSTSPASRLYATLAPTSPRKWAFGTTALATDVRYQSYTGTNQDYYNQIVCVASHQVNAITEIWLDNEQAWTSAGGVQGRYAGFLTVTAITLGTSANGIAIDGVWTASCTLTGCAYVYLKFKISDNSDTSKSPFAGGVSSRVTIRGNGALVYDPRLDSTVVGGAGSQLAGTQSTWAWSATASRNPALQLLWYLLGWQINSKLALGMGLPSARIDLPSFITAANACDTSITLNGGGTEPRYACDGVLSEGDDRTAVIDALASQMNAVLRDAGGKLSLTVIVNDLATPTASFTEKDILGAEQWDQTPQLHKTFNIVRGQRIDPSDNALYQPSDFPEVKLTSNDGIDRIDTIQYTLTQSNGQAQRLAKQRLQRNQYQGQYSFTGGPRWWQTSLGNVVQLSHQGLGWSNKLFRVVGQAISRGGDTKMTLLEENAAIYAWANNETAAVVAATPTVYDPRNAPILQGVVVGSTAVSTNAIKDLQFGNAWTLAAGAVRKTAVASLGYAIGNQPYYCEISPSVTLLVSAKSELIAVSPGQRVYFKIDCQRGTTVGTGSRLNMGHEWVKADKTTLSATASVEGTQQSPTTLTAGAVPLSVYWAGVAPSDAAFVRINPYSPILASSSGTFRVEAPVVSFVDLGGPPSISYGPASYTALYNADGTAQTGTLPFTLTYRLYLGGSQQTAGVTWTYKVTSGSVNGFTAASAAQAMSGAGTGSLTVTVLGSDSSVVQITAVASNGSTATTSVTIAKQFSAANPTGAASGDVASQTTGFTSFGTTAYTVVSNTLTFTVPTGKTSITASISLTAMPVRGGADGSWTVQMKLQRLIAAVWTDQGAVMSGTSSLFFDGDIQQRSGASISGTIQTTTLTAGTQYSYRIVAEITTTGPSHNVTGSVVLATP